MNIETHIQTPKDVRVDFKSSYETLYAALPLIGQLGAEWLDAKAKVAKVVAECEEAKLTRSRAEKKLATPMKAERISQGRLIAALHAAGVISGTYRLLDETSSLEDIMHIVECIKKQRTSRIEVK